MKKAKICYIYVDSCSQIQLSRLIKILSKIYNKIKVLNNNGLQGTEMWTSKNTEYMEYYFHFKVVNNKILDGLKRFINKYNEETHNYLRDNLGPEIPHLTGNTHGNQMYDIIHVSLSEKITLNFQFTTFDRKYTW